MTKRVMKKKLLLLLLLTLVCLKTFGSTQVLLDITGDRKASPQNNKTRLLVDVSNTGDITKIISIVIAENGQEGERKEFDPIEYGNKYMVLSRKLGVDVVRLWASSFARHNGGNLKLDYLTSIVNRRRDSISLELVNDGSVWMLLDSKNNRQLKSLHIIGKTFFGKLIGLKKMERRY